MCGCQLSTLRPPPPPPAVLVDVSTFRPKILIHNDLLHLRLELSDLTSLPGTNAVAVEMLGLPLHLRTREVRP